MASCAISNVADVPGLNDLLVERKQLYAKSGLLSYNDRMCWDLKSAPQWGRYAKGQ